MSSYHRFKEENIELYPNRKRNMLKIKDINPDFLGKNRKKFRQKINIKVLLNDEILKRYSSEFDISKAYKNPGENDREDFKNGDFIFGKYKTNFSILKKQKPKLYTKFLFIIYNKPGGHTLRLSPYEVKVKYLDKKILKIGENLMNKSKKIFEQTKIPLRGIFVKKYILRSYFHGEKNFFYNQMYLRNRIFSNKFYLNIEDNKNNNILLNYINKNFYIKYMKKPYNELNHKKGDEWFRLPRDYTYVQKSSP